MQGLSVLLIVIDKFIFVVVSKPLLFASVNPLALAPHSIFANVGAHTVLLSCFPLANILPSVSPDKRALAFAFVVDEVTLVLLAVSPLENAETVHFIFRP
jgi:hypothetical protein